MEIEREELEAMWAKLRQHEKSLKELSSRNAKVAMSSAALFITHTFNLWVTTFRVWQPEELDGYLEYIKPRKEIAMTLINKTVDVKKMFETAADFNNECLDYYNKHRVRQLSA